MDIKTRAPSLVMIILLIGFPSISETIYTPSLPNIAHALATSNHLVEWTLSIYFIGFAIGIAYWGKLSDRIGRRKAMLWGLSIYCIGCLFCLLSFNINLLLLSRLVQAFGASSASVLAQTMIRDLFSGKKRNQIFSIVSMAVGIAPALGPIVGGYLVQWFHWQANFTFLLLLGMVLLIANFFTLAETHPSLKADLPSQSWLRVAKKLLCDQRVLGCVFLIGAFNGILFSYYAEAPFIFINILHFLPSQFGMFGVTVAAGSIIGGRLSHKFNEFFHADTIILMGCLISLGSILLLNLAAFSGMIAHAHKNLAVLGVIVPIGLFAIGFATALPNILSNALTHYKDVIGTAGSIFGLGYYLLTAGMTFLMGYLHNGTVFPMPIYFLSLSLLMVLVCVLTIKNSQNH